jgi:hypothetical protein
VNVVVKKGDFQSSPNSQLGRRAFRCDNNVWLRLLVSRGIEHRDTPEVLRTKRNVLQMN